MSLDVTIRFKEPRQANYFLDHPYTYDRLSARDKEAFAEETEWWGNITHNLNSMAMHIPVHKEEREGVCEYSLYEVCWRPEEQDWKTTDDILPMLVEGIAYMVERRKELLQYDSPNGWGTYVGFMKFLLNYKQACEDNPGCEIYASR